MSKSVSKEGCTDKDQNADSRLIRRVLRVDVEKAEREVVPARGQRDNGTGRNREGDEDGNGEIGGEER